jgi:outer membrane protein assembly factor BamB
VLALNAADGEERWSSRLPAPAATTPVPYRDLLLVAARNDSIYALTRANGRIVARAPIGGHASAPPALAGDTLYLPLEAGGIVALGLPAMARLFRAGGSAPVLAPPALGADGTVYFLDSSAELWKLPPGSASASRLASLGGAARGGLTLTASGLLVGRLDGVLTLVRLDGGTTWTTRLDGSIAAPAAVVGGAAYVPLQGGRIVKIQ